MENHLKDANFITQAEVLKILAHPVRLCIVKGLSEGSDGCVVSKMQSCLKIPQSTISQHLSKLRAAKIVTAEHRGTSVCYNLADTEEGQLARRIVS